MTILFVPINVLYDNRTCAILLILQHTSIRNIQYVLFKLRLWFLYIIACSTLVCDSCTCRFYSVVIHVWHPRFPLHGIKKYLYAFFQTSKKPGKGQASSSKGKAPAKGKAASSKGKGKGQR